MKNWLCINLDYIIWRAHYSLYYTRYEHSAKYAQMPALSNAHLKNWISFQMSTAFSIISIQEHQKSSRGGRWSFFRPSSQFASGGDDEGWIEKKKKKERGGDED